jgi:hypothetical protein
MDQGFVDWSSLSKKERKRLIKERKRQEMESNKKRGGIIKWVIIAVVLALFIWGVMWFIKEASKPIPGSELPNQGRDHVPEKEWGKFKYNSNPPTSGPHDAVWTKGGAYDQPQGDGHLVHSLEHGYVIISHNCDMNKSEVRSQKLEVGTESAEMDKRCMDFVDKLKGRVEKDAWKLILVPRPNLDANFALTAWTRIEKFNLPAGKAGTEEASIEKVNNFIDSFRNHGPEQTME